MPDDLDFLASLDAEISAVTEKQSLEDRKETLQKRLRNHATTAEARARATDELKALDSRLTEILWKPVSNVALFTEQHCKSCNSVHRVFLQHMQRQVTNSGPKVDRLTRIARPFPGLPNEVVLQTSETYICSDCADAYGFDISAATKMTGSSTVSKTYTQEAPDAPNE